MAERSVMRWILGGRRLHKLRTPLHVPTSQAVHYGMRASCARLGTSGCTTPDPAKACHPRYYGGSAGGGVGEDGAPSAGGGQASTPPTGTVGTPIVDTSDDDDVDSNDDSGVVSPGRPGQHPHHFGGFGCALANASNTTPSGLSTLLFGVGVALGMRRRRARK